ncbi:hypothetical protein HNV12_00260 [Methanococcoides sp. SA1]|nr:hypothetical protein [Methanococcoides sp. SA1]
MAKKKSHEKTLKLLKKNTWQISTGVLAVLLIASFLTAGLTGATISPEKAGANVLAFALEQGANAEFVSASDSGSLYQVVLSIDGQEVPVFVTKDGKTLVPQPITIVEEEVEEAEPTEIPQVKTPEVELFIWSYCPYGVMAQGPLAEVALLLGDKANFKAVMYHDGHGDYETYQNKIQACIQKLQPEKYWNYAAEFVSDIYPKCSQERDIACDRTESIKLMNSLGINSNAVMTCVDKDGDSLIAADTARAQATGVTGSPTLMVNGVKANVARSAEAYKGAVCSAFTESPETCGETLSKEETQATGNC